MTDPRFGEVFEGYVDLATQLVKSWTPLVTDVSAKVDSGTYDNSDASADFSAVAKLVTDSLMAIGSEAIDALAILTSDFSEQSESGPFGIAPANVTRKLALKGNLKSASGQELPKERVTPVPAVLAPNGTQFALNVNGTGMKARTYDGFVTVTSPGTAKNPAGESEEIFVSVTIG